MAPLTPPAEASTSRSLLCSIPCARSSDAGPRGVRPSGPNARDTSRAAWATLLGAELEGQRIDSRGSKSCLSPVGGERRLAEAVASKVSSPIARRRASRSAEVSAIAAVAPVQHPATEAAQQACGLTQGCVRVSRLSLDLAPKDGARAE
jgi:hypothetical protein